MACSFWGSEQIRSTSRPERALLLNAPPYDTRLPWSKWQQPSLLLRLSTLLKNLGSDVYLIDSLTLPDGTTRMPRTRTGFLHIDGIAVSKWRFGLPAATITAQMHALKARDWHPDVIYVECGMTYWWEGAADIISLAKKSFPGVPVVLLGTYAAMAQEHAQEHFSVDLVTSEAWPELNAVAADLSVCRRLPSHHLILLGDGHRSVDAIVEEVENAARQNVRDLAFAEHSPATQSTDIYVEVLERLTERNLKLRLYALGSVAASELVARPELAVLMKQAGYVQVCFADDRESSFNSARHEQVIRDYRDAAMICEAAGFPTRTEQLVASVCVGQKGEDLTERARFITLASHHVGSVIVWPYQPTVEECRRECPAVTLEDQNGKVFPLRDAKHTYRDYLNVLGLATVFNSKHRSRTFDFLGNSLTAKLFQDSIARRGWIPNDDVKGSIKLPMLARSAS